MDDSPEGSTPRIYSRPLFIFLNDLMFALKHTDPVNYADGNTYVHCQLPSGSYPETCSRCYISIDWFTHNDMQANPPKFHFMVTGSSIIQLTLRAATIEQEDYVKLLGVNIGKKLDFKFHVNEVCRKSGRPLVWWPGGRRC